MNECLTTILLITLSLSLVSVVAIYAVNIVKKETVPFDSSSQTDNVTQSFQGLLDNHTDTQ